MVSGSSTLTADRQSLAATLDNPANDFATLVLATANGGRFTRAEVADANSLTIGGNADALIASAGAALTASGGAYTTLDLSAAGSITQTGALSAAGATTLTADGAPTAITLTGPANDFAGISLAARNGGSVTTAVLSDANSLAIGGNAVSLSATAGQTLSLAGGAYTSLSATAGSSIVQTGTLSAANATLGADSQPVSATLTDAANDFDRVTLSSTNGGHFAAVSLADADALAIGGDATALALRAAGALTFTGGRYTSLAATAGGAIAQSGALAVAGSTGLTADTNAIAITLADAGNDFASVVLAAANGGQVSRLTIADANAVTIGGDAAALAVTAGAGLSFSGGNYTTIAATAQGSMAQTGAIAAGTATFTADRQPATITLANTGNDFGRVVLAAANGGSVAAVQITDANTLAIGGNAGTLNATAGAGLELTGGSYGSLAATAAGNITQSGALVAGSTTLTADTQAITVALTDAANDFDTITLADRNGGSFANVDIADVDTFSLGGNAASLSLSVGGPLTLAGGSYGSLNASARGNITQTGALSVDNATMTIAGVAANVTLTDAANDFGTLSLAARDGGRVALAQVVDANALTIGGDADVLSVRSGAALTFSGGRSRTLDAISGGDVDQTGALIVSGLTTLTADGASISALLEHPGNDFGSVTLAGANGGQAAIVRIADTSALAIGGDAVALSATTGGALLLTGGHYTTLEAVSQGDITQSAGVTVTDTTVLTADTNAVAATLTDAGNDFNVVVLTGNRGGSFSSANVTDANSLIAGGDAVALNAVSDGPLTLAGGLYSVINARSKGNITQSGGLTVLGGTVLIADGQSITATLNSPANNFTSVTFGSTAGGSFSLADVVDANALTIGGNVGTLNARAGGALTLSGGGYATLNLTALGDIVQTGAMTVTGSTTLTADGTAIAARLSDPFNDFGGLQLAGRNGGRFTLAEVVDRSALSLGGPADTLSVATGDALTFTGGSYASLAATSAGTIGQSAAIGVRGETTLTTAAANLAITLTQTGNDFAGVTLAAQSGASIADARLVDAGALAIGGDAGSLTLTTGGALTLRGGSLDTLTASSRGDIVQSGALQIGGVATLIANGAPIAANLGGANELNRVVLASAGGGSFGSVSLNDLDTRHDGLAAGGDAAALALSAAGPLTLTGGRYGSLDVTTADAAVNQSGVLAVSGAARVDAGGGDITLADAGNDFATFSAAGGHDVTLVDANTLRLGSSDVSGRLDVTTPGEIRFDGVLQGTGALVKRGAGTMWMDSTHTYSGGTTIADGSLSLDGPAGSAGSGTLVLGATGVLDLRNGAVLPNALISQGGILRNGAGSGTLAGALTLQATTTLDAAADGLTLAGAIGDGGAGIALVKAGAGLATLSGPNSASGVTRIDAGTLHLAGPSAIAETSAVTLAAGATLELGHDQAIGSLAGAGQVLLAEHTLAAGADGRSTLFSGSLAGSGGLAKRGAGTLTLSGDNSYSGSTTIAAGTLVASGGAAIADASAVGIAAGARLQLAEAETIGSLAGAGTVALNGHRLAAGADGRDTLFSGAIAGSGGFTKIGGGTLALSGANAFTGGTNIAGGSLQIRSGDALPSAGAVAIAGGATLALQSDLAIGSLAGAGTVALAEHRLSTGQDATDTTFAGQIAGSGSLEKAGSGRFTLSGANLYSGTTTVAGGTLILAGGAAIADTSALTVGGAGALELADSETVGSLAGAGAVRLGAQRLAAGGDGSDTLFSGVLSGSGGLSKQGAGTLTLTGANLNSGATAIEAGTLQIAAGGGAGALGSGEVVNDGTLRFERSDAVTLANALSGSGELIVGRGSLTLASAANRYTGATRVLAGAALATAGAERLPDSSAVAVAAGAQLTLAGDETLGAIEADGDVLLRGSVTSAGDQHYRGALQIEAPGAITLAARDIEALNAANRLGSTALSLRADTVALASGVGSGGVHDDLVLGDVALADGGQLTAGRLSLNGNVALAAGTLAMHADALPDDSLAVVSPTAQVPTVVRPLAVAEATVVQAAGSTIAVEEGATLAIAATGGGSVRLGEDGNRFSGALSVLSGPQYGTAWVPNVRGVAGTEVGIQAQVFVAGSEVQVGGAGIEADIVHVRADRLVTSGDALLAARLPFDDVLLGTSLSTPSMVLELAPAAFDLAFPFGNPAGGQIQVSIGAREIGARSTGPNAGFLTILPKTGARGATAVFLAGPQVESVVDGYRFFQDGASVAGEIPVFYNSILPQTPQVTSSLSAVASVSESARKDRFEEAVRTENVAVRLRGGVIAEVGPGRPATVGSEGAKPPEGCPPAEGSLACAPGPSSQGSPRP